METIEQKRLALLDETVEYYTTHSRATILKPDGTNTFCSYVATEGNDGCAIGRKISPELRAKLQVSNSTVGGDYDTYIALPTELQELGREFLSELQCLHDGRELWDKKEENGNVLTEKGVLRYDYIKRRYCV